MAEYSEKNGKEKSNRKKRDSNKPANQEKDYFGKSPAKLDKFLSETNKKDNQGQKNRYFGEKPSKLDNLLSEPGKIDNKDKGDKKNEKNNDGQKNRYFGENTEKLDKILSKSDKIKSNATQNRKLDDFYKKPQDMTTLLKSKKFPEINQSFNNDKQSGLYSSPTRIVTRYYKDGTPVKVKIYPDGTEKIIIGDKELSPVSFKNQTYNKSKPTFTKNKKNPITQSETRPKNEPNQKEKTNPKIDYLKIPIEKDPDILGKILKNPPKKITKKANKTVETGRMYYMKNEVTQKRYIGQTTLTINERLNDHFKEAKSKRDHTRLNNSIRKHGRENFSIHEFQKMENQKQWALDGLETHYIAKYHTQDPTYGYNIAPGGKGGKHAPETLEKIKQSNIKAKAHLKGVPLSEEHRQKISKGLTGLKKTEETKQKIAQSHRGMITSDETKKLLSDMNTGEKNPFFGKRHSESTIKKMSDGKKGEKNPFHGKHHTEASRRLMSEANKGIPNTQEQKRKMSETKVQNFKDSNPIDELAFRNAVNKGATTKEIAEEFNLRKSAVSTWLGHLYGTSKITEAREKSE